MAPTIDALALPAPDLQVAQAEVGNYFVAGSPTPGTGIALSSAARTTFTVNESAMLFKGPTSAGVRAIPHYARLVCTAAGVALTSAEFLLKTDTVDRESVNGTILTANNLNLGSARASECQLQFGNCVLANETAAKAIARFRAKAAIWNVGDQLTIWFGTRISGPGVLTGTPANMEVWVPAPILVGGGVRQSMLLHYWAPAQSTSPSFEASFGWFER